MQEDVNLRNMELDCQGCPVCDKLGLAYSVIYYEGRSQDNEFVDGEEGESGIANFCPNCGRAL